MSSLTRPIVVSGSNDIVLVFPETKRNVTNACGVCGTSCPCTEAFWGADSSTLVGMDAKGTEASGSVVPADGGNPCRDDDDCSEPFSGGEASGVLRWSRSCDTTLEGCVT